MRHPHQPLDRTILDPATSAVGLAMRAVCVSTGIAYFAMYLSPIVGASVDRAMARVRSLNCNIAATHHVDAVTDMPIRAPK